MLLTYGDHRDKVCAYMTRDPGVFVTPGGRDLVLAATNDARHWAVQMVNFEYCRAIASLTLALNAATPLSSAVYWGTTTPISINFVEQPYIVAAGAVSIYSGIPIKWYTRSKDAFFSYLDRQATPPLVPIGTPLIPVDPTLQAPMLELALFQVGPNVYPSAAFVQQFPGVNTTQIGLDVYDFLPDYVNANDTDFFLTFCSNWLMYRTIYQLNMFLKEDQRVGLSAKVLDDAWTGVQAWNNRIEQQKSDSFLD